MILTVRIILVVSIIERAYGLCGAPGESQLLKVDSLIEVNNETEVSFFGYDEGTEITYSCVNKSLLLVGSPSRKCISGHWTHRIPHCVSKIDSTLYTSVVEIDTLKVSFTSATEISALRIVEVSSDLKILEPSTFTCNAVNASLICISDSVKNVENLSLRFDKELNMNESGVEFFNFVEDTCELPDVPAFANLEVQEKCKVTDNCTRFTYKCSRHFNLQPKNYGNIHCETDGEKIPICIPSVLCAKLSVSDIFEQKYSAPTPWNSTHFLPDSILTYNCKEKDYILRGDSSRRCSRNGTWLGETPVCEFNPRNGTVPVPVPSAPEIFNMPMLIALSSLVIGTVLIVFFLIIIIHKRNQRIAQLQRLGSLRSRNFYFDVPIQTKPSYKHGTRVDDNIGLTSSDYNMDAAIRDTAIFYTKDIGESRYSRTADRFSLPSNGFQYEMPGHLPAVLVTDDPTIPQISL